MTDITERPSATPPGASADYQKTIRAKMATSSADDAPRELEFLYDLHRLNVATSRGPGDGGRGGER